MAQTAVDWLVKELELEGYDYTIQKAKEMEKQQIMDAYWNGTVEMEKQDALIDAEKFYNEYYGKKK
jgi:hypothetical protein